MAQPQSIQNDSKFSDDRGRIVCPILLLAMGLGVYWQSILFDFVNYDDLALTTGNALLKGLDLATLKRIFTFLSIESYYPIRLLTIAVDKALWGDNPMGYHLTNVLIHEANMLLAYALASKIGREQNWEPQAARGLGFFTALLYGVHPALTDTVAWIPGREELLMFFFCLVCLRLHMHADHSARPLLVRVLTGYACAFACLSNVVGAMSPALVGLYIMTLDPKGSWKKVILTTWFLWVIGILTVFVKGLSLLTWDESSRSLVMPHLPSAIRYFHEILEMPRTSYTDPVGFMERVRAVLGVYGANLLHVFAPVKMPCVYPNYAPKGFISIQVLGGCAAVAATAVALIRFRKHKIFVFGVGWFLISLAPSSQIFQHHIQRADRFLYMPLWGLSLAVCFGILMWERRCQRPWGKILLMTAILCLSLRTVYHLPVWYNGLAFHQHATKSNPDYYLVHHNYAQELKRQELNYLALTHQAKAVELCPAIQFAWTAYYELLIQLNMLDKAEAIARKALEDFPEDSYVYNNLAIILSKKGDHEGAIEYYEEAVALFPMSTVMRSNVAMEYTALNQPEMAVHHLGEALRISPRAPALHFHMANELERSGDISGAIHHFKEAKRYGSSQDGLNFHTEFLENELKRRKGVREWE